MKRILIFFICLCIYSCSSSDGEGNDQGSTNPPVGDNGGPSGNNEWLIPISQVRDGGPGRDGIPSIDNPKFLNVAEAPGLLRDEERIIGVKVGNDVRAYPHYILDWHEIVNDDVDNVSVAVTYCPLTGSAIGWDRNINGVKTSFGVSGLLYNNNVIPFDRSTGSNWSQLRLECVNGSLIGTTPELVQLVETNWFVWKTMYPNTKILSTETGFDRTYGVYPYGDYRTNNDNLIFPLSRDDSRLPRKERVHAVINDEKAKAFRFNSFSNNNVIYDTFNGKDIVLIGDNTLIVSFELDSSAALLDFEYVFKDSEVFFTDNEGNEWNVFGEAISGRRIGQKLKPTQSFIAYWFSIGAFYPNAEIFEN